ncbi:MAG: dCMP deaminase family protein, partial [Patescibacteria group bacterium]|nr:dCMP deaminase family protein [Patescibacteria group bacterium]
FQTMARLVGRRSTCPRARVGAVIVKDGRVISIGYVGSPSGMPHCTEVGCDIDEARGGCIRTVHAEANAIAFAAKSGIEVAGSTIYCTHLPCIDCAKLILNAGIREVVYQHPYRDERGLDLFLRSGRVKVRVSS